MRDEGVIAALHEESVKRLTGAAIVGVSVLLEIAQSEDHKDRFKAAKELAAINGFTAEQRIRVEHVTEDKRDLIEQIKGMARELKLDPKQLLAGVGVTEGEFTEVPDE
jgi:chemotaxis response regulator CheB